MAPPDAHEPQPADSPPLPDEQAWTSIGVACGREIHGGHQTRVFAAEHSDQAVVVKLTDCRYADPAHQQRLEVLERLAGTNPDVVGPLRFGSDLTGEVEGWLVAMYPFVKGRTPDIESEKDVRGMANALVRLHRTLAELSPTGLPPVAALIDVDLPAALNRPTQLLHGDFSNANLLLDGDRTNILDFDGCGYGPVEFELGDTLYMVLFDAAISADLSRYERFRHWFIDEYRSATSVSDAALDAAIDVRVRALERWLDHPETAPIGIRTAEPAWHDVLRGFIRSTRGN